MIDHREYFLRVLQFNPRFLVMEENIKNGRIYLILGQNSISSLIFNILPHYEKPGVIFEFCRDVIYERFLQLCYQRGMNF
jgi:hypothetical protein